MIAKFSGTCARCGHAIKKGEEINYQDRKAFHPDCQGETPDDQEELAERIGYLKHDTLLELLRRRMSNV